MNKANIPQTLAESLENLTTLVDQHYRGLWNAVEAVLVVFAVMSFKRRTKPLCLVLETVSGRGKTAVIQMFFPLPAEAGPGLAQYVYRSDKFTPKAFVTHVANVPKKNLASLDMLPQLKDKVLLTKELAPIFRGKTDELEDNFSTLITVLDGKGFTSNSGTQGRRDYELDIIFNWVGATTPISQQTYRLMSQLGTRLLFYWVVVENATEEELLDYAELEDAGQAEADCQQAANRFILDFFQEHPVSSVEPGSITIPKDLLRQLVRWAKFLATCRAAVRSEKLEREWEPVSANAPEGPHKIINSFKLLARAHALIHGCTEVNESDLELVGHVAFSSLPEHLRPLVWQLRRQDWVETGVCQYLCGVSSPTARKYMKETSILGLTILEEREDFSNRVTLAPEFQWLRLAVPKLDPEQSAETDPES